MLKFILLALGVLDLATGFVFCGIVLTVGSSMWILCEAIDRMVSRRVRRDYRETVRERKQWQRNLMTR